MSEAEETIQFFIRKTDRVTIYARRSRGRESMITLPDFEIMHASAEDPSALESLDLWRSSVPDHDSRRALDTEKIRQLCALETNLKLQIFNFQRELSPNPWAELGARSSWNQETLKRTVLLSNDESKTLLKRTHEAFVRWCIDVNRCTTMEELVRYFVYLRANTVLGAYTVANKLDED